MGKSYRGAKNLKNAKFSNFAPPVTFRLTFLQKSESTFLKYFLYYQAQGCSRLRNVDPQAWMHNFAYFEPNSRRTFKDLKMKTRKKAGILIPELYFS